MSRARQEPEEAEDQVEPSLSEYLGQEERTHLAKLRELKRKHKLSKELAFQVYLLLLHPTPGQPVDSAFWSLSSELLQTSSGIYGKRVEFLQAQSTQLASHLAKDIRQRLQRSEQHQTQLRQYGFQSLNSNLVDPLKVNGPPESRQFTADPMLRQTAGRFSAKSSCTLLLNSVGVDRHLALQLVDNGQGSSALGQRQVSTTARLGLLEMASNVCTRLKRFKLNELGLRQEDQQDLPREMLSQQLPLLEKQEELFGEQYENADSTQTNLKQEYLQQFEEKEFADILGNGQANQYFQLINLRPNVVKPKTKQKSRQIQKKVQIVVDWQTQALEQEVIVRGRTKRGRDSKKQQKWLYNLQEGQKRSDRRVLQCMLEPRFARGPDHSSPASEVGQPAISLEEGIGQLPDQQYQPEPARAVRWVSKNMKQIKLNLLKEIRDSGRPKLSELGEGLSQHLRFISLLHLANEEGFSLHSDQAQADVHIIK